MEGGKREGRRKGKKEENGGRGMASTRSQFGKVILCFHISHAPFFPHFFILLLSSPSAA